MALFLPWLAAERILAAGSAPAHRPLALTVKERGALRLAATCPQAAALGLVPGMALADARAHVPDLHALDHDAAGDAALLSGLVRRAVRFTPTVEPDPPGGLLLDIAGCAHLFGGEAAMRDKAVADIGAAAGKGRRFTVHAALADTPDAARALARYGGANVRALPVAALELAEEAETALRRAGLKRISDLADRPRAPLAARFGSELVLRLDRFLGREDRHLTATAMRAPLIFEMRFAEPIGREEDVLDAVEQLGVEAMQALAERGQGGRAFRVRLYRSDGHVAELAIETGAPTRDVALLLRLLRERIDSLADPLDPGFGYDAVTLGVPLSEELAERQQVLQRAERRSPEISALTDRLAVRHGEAGISVFSGDDSHMPERAGMLRARHAARLGTRLPQDGEPPLRPLLLLDPPQKIEVLAAVPDGPPRRFRWRGIMHRVTAHEGPERLAREWWRRAGGHVSGEGGNPGLSRDYYRIEDEDGRRFWVFRLGLYERETDWPCWYVHGLFA